ncbi:GIY-YIG nuclease family protein [Polaribacter sp. WD7]|uniref:GIY-YIG nuclease family protein n=1 Tax=Polaribacter sp. WD7 TaxID=2269061 RepID=UPI000DF23026|nr:GIY-YIG nuclease family protein [Polaribacter sp. WD7]RCS28399.1 GIY-YIG nuclease family protein [Polaribacter sp. WD7]
MKKSFVYILTNTYRTTFYIGVTVNLSKRLYEHYDETASLFTKKYNLKDLIYLEEFSDINQAIAREKQLKNWHKEWKLNLVKRVNPNLKTSDYQ